MNEIQFSKLFSKFQEQQKLIIKEVIKAVLNNGLQTETKINFNYSAIGPFENYNEKRKSLQFIWRVLETTVQ